MSAAGSLALSPPPPYDVRSARADFPALSQTVYGRRLVYLDNAATTQKPRAVIDALCHWYSTDCSNVHRGLHALSERSTAAYEAARAAVQQFLNARASRENPALPAAPSTFSASDVSDSAPSPVPIQMTRGRRNEGKQPSPLSSTSKG